MRVRSGPRACRYAAERRCRPTASAFILCGLRLTWAGQTAYTKSGCTRRAYTEHVAQGEDTGAALVRVRTFWRARMWMRERKVQDPGRGRAIGKRR
jgi:hypothetical protein